MSVKCQTRTFNLPDNPASPASIEEVEKLSIEQWQPQLPEVRRKLLEATKRRPDSE